MMSEEIINMAEQARQASIVLQSSTTKQKNATITKIREFLEKDKETILKANQQDLEKAKLEVDAGHLSASLYKRLDLSRGDKYQTLLEGVTDVVQLPDPTGKITLATKMDEGLELYRVTCPIGVLLIIFEARPEVVVQISCLAIKSGNAVILKGGKEAYNSNVALYKSLQNAILSLPPEQAIPLASIQLISSREEINELLVLDQYIDLVIPRGSKKMVRYIQENTRIPVLGHADGLCSIYVDEFADVQKSLRVITDAKIDYPAACNAVETLLIHSDVVQTQLPAIAKNLVAHGVHMRADERAFSVLQSTDIATEMYQASTPEDFDTEFLELILAIKVVDSLQEAIDHINIHGSHHTESIITENKENAELFMAKVDAAGVFWNASTRFSDGFRYGFGAEIGVSTNKTHARGPVGLNGLVIYKYKIYGSGQAVSDYEAGKKSLLHSKIPIDQE
jgi:glutamate-5-semialdehyde dehydrogenase